ncbi:MAG: hypothetical protein HOW73_00820 [Polyangiaceae bacterium]|nr:hypothetical protein [Polyangiaceae bacterium]
MTPRLQKAVFDAKQAVERLKTMRVIEVSVVDFPANRTPFLLLKRADVLGTALADAERVLSEFASAPVAKSDALERAIAAAEAMVSSLGAAPALDLRVIRKSADGPELQYVLGLVLAPNTVDSQQQIYDAEVIRKASWGYMKDFRNLGYMHTDLINGKAQIVESYLAPVDMQIGETFVRKGTWLLGLHVTDAALWSEIRTGKLGGLSIGGFAA